MVDALNPAHRLWSDGRWNKITLAHGCYWKRCAFCDITLDYIARYEKAPTARLADLMEELVEETGSSGFHFVDEAAPPRLMRDLAIELLRRGTAVSWWGNIRFERAFTPDLARLLSAAGLIAVTGGLEVASDRLLAEMDKGITVEQAAQTCWAFQQAGVLVHAYLMYGFPTQTAQETMDAMEVVRQLFDAGLLDSAFWHRFTLTRHSGVYADPERYRVQVPPPPPGAFALNDIPHADPDGAEHDMFEPGLSVALAAWMQGRGLQQPLITWFNHPLPFPQTAKDRIAKALPRHPPPMKPRDRLLWIGGEPLVEGDTLVLHPPRRRGAHPRPRARARLAERGHRRGPPRRGRPPHLRRREGRLPWQLEEAQAPLAPRAGGGPARGLIPEPGEGRGESPALVRLRYSLRRPRWSASPKGDARDLPDRPPEGTAGCHAAGATRRPKPEAGSGFGSPNPLPASG